MKFITFVLVILLLPAVLFSADSTMTDPTGWQKTLIFDLTTTQTSYSNSWVGGEAGSFNWVGNINGTAEKQLAPSFDFKSTLKMSFGQTVTQDAETKDWGDFVKSTDLIDFENVGRLTKGWVVDPYIAFRLESQFYDGRIDSMKQYFSPLKLTESAGIAKVMHVKDKDQVTTRLGLALRQIIKSEVDTLTDPANYTVEDSTLTDGGLESVTDAVFKLSERINYTGKLSLYKAFFFSKSDQVKGTESEDYWKAIDVNWENMITAQVSKIIAVNLYTQILYDKQISKKGRFKETVAIGFVFKLM